MKEVNLKFKLNKKLEKVYTIIRRYYEAAGFTEEEILLFMFSLGISNRSDTLSAVADETFKRGHLDMYEYIDLKNLFKDTNAELKKTLQDKFAIPPTVFLGSISDLDNELNNE